MERVRILLVKAGETAHEVRDSHGDYDDWFRSALAAEPVSWQVVRPYGGEPLPRVPEADGVIISGSPLSLTTPEPWMFEAAEWVRTLLERETPLLGVCFGHQLLGWALGARVVRNPRGREVGTQSIRLTARGRVDPLFEGVGEEALVQTTHEDVLDGPPPGTLVLAGNSNTPLQAFAAGARVRAVQFHPELSEEGMRRIVQTRHGAIVRDAAARGEPGEEAYRRTLEAVSATPAGRLILTNFLRHVVGAGTTPSASMRA